MFCPNKSRPEYWNGLGSSKSRSVTQQEEATVTVQTLVENCTYNDLIVFTDGSCLGNPESCGQGHVYLYQINRVCHAQETCH